MCCVELALKGVLSTRLGGKGNLKKNLSVQRPDCYAMLVSPRGAHCEIGESLIVDLEQVLIPFIIENDHSASALMNGRLQAKTRRR